MKITTRVHEPPIPMDNRAFDLSAFHAIVAAPYELPEHWGNIRCCQEAGAEYAADSGSGVEPPSTSEYVAMIRKAGD